MTEELKPCPFCGNELISTGWTHPRRVYADEDIVPAVFWMVTCGCGATMLVRMKNRDDDDDDLPTAKEAAKIVTDNWNKRAYCTDDNPTMNI